MVGLNKKINDNKGSKEQPKVEHNEQIRKSKAESKSAPKSRMI